MRLHILRLTSIFCTIGFTLASSSQQIVMENNNQDTFARPQGNLPTLADLLTLETRVSIFYTYARDTEMSEQLSKPDAEAITVFAPTNKAVMALARKPHEDAVGVVRTEAEFDEVTKTNVVRWVGAHMIPAEVELAAQKPYDTLTPGVTISFKYVNGAYHPPGEPTIKNDVDNGNLNHDTDAAHFGSIKGPSVNSQKSTEEPAWMQYEINGGVRMIERREASNGVLYLIDGTIEV